MAKREGGGEARKLTMRGEGKNKKICEKKFASNEPFVRKSEGNNKMRLPKKEKRNAKDADALSMKPVMCGATEGNWGSDGFVKFEHP